MPEEACEVLNVSDSEDDVMLVGEEEKEETAASATAADVADKTSLQGKVEGL